MTERTPTSIFASTPATLANRRSENVARTVLAIVTVLLVLPLLAILGLLILNGAPALSVDFLLEYPAAGMTAGGIFPAIVGTLWLVGVSLLVAAPIGVMAAIYLNEYAPENWMTRIIHLAIVNLAGVPSIVHALFGLGARGAFAGMGRSILAASLTLAIMTLPVIIASTKEALASVPMSFREACWNVGATRWQTIRNVVLPLGIPGIVTGIVLTSGRIFGEAAALIFTAGLSTPSNYDFGNFNLADPTSPWSPFHSATTLSVYIWKLNSEGLGDFVSQIADTSAAILVIAVLVFNLGARGLGRLMTRRISGSLS